MAGKIAVIGALDTKSDEFLFVKKEIEKRGYKALLINVGIVDDPRYEPDVAADEVARAAGSSLAILRDKSDRGLAIETMTRGIGQVIIDLYSADRFQAVISMGGSAGTEIGTAGMRALPLGVPKVMVSTLASGDTRPYVGTRDIVMVPSIVDVAGINHISALVYASAVGAVIGMLETTAPKIEEKPILAASMFGNTTPVVNRCRSIMEDSGYEFIIFHQVGTPETLESLVADGYISGVLDITTTEWADELLGGVLSAGPHRLEAAGKAGVPAIVTPGCLDMVNFGEPDTVPERFRVSVCPRASSWA